jgi:hypothetical protein
MHDRGDDPSPPLPRVALADEQAIAQKRRQCVPHLRAFTCKTLVPADEGVLDGVGAVAHEQHAREHPRRKEFPRETPLFPNREHVLARKAQGGEY